MSQIKNIIKPQTFIKIIFPNRHSEQPKTLETFLPQPSKPQTHNNNNKFLASGHLTAERKTFWSRTWNIKKSHQSSSNNTKAKISLHALQAYPEKERKNSSFFEIIFQSCYIITHQISHDVSIIWPDQSRFSSPLSLASVLHDHHQAA